MLDWKTKSSFSFLPFISTKKMKNKINKKTVIVIAQQKFRFPHLWSLCKWYSCWYETASLFVISYLAVLSSTLGHNPPEIFRCIKSFRIYADLWIGGCTYIRGTHKQLWSQQFAFSEKHLKYFQNLWRKNYLLWQIFIWPDWIGSTFISHRRSTRYSNRLHDFFVTISRCYMGVYVNSFFP